MTDTQDKVRGEQAQRLLGDPLLNEAFTVLGERLKRLMVEAHTDEATLKAKQCLGLLADVQNWLTRIVTDGAVAAESIRIAEAQERLRAKGKVRV